MQIHEIGGEKKRRKRIGRGGKRGTYSGKGNKGQKARSGAHVNPLFEGGRSSLVERLKKVRGFKSPHPKKSFVKLSDVARMFSAGETVSLDTLLEKRMVSTDALKRGCKVIGSGVLPKNLIFESVLSFSDGAKACIEEHKGLIRESPEEKEA
ncbi:MAG: 50S ribosomal protein L15 [Candidatus Moraniibacteriota bacterium]|nr:MAG: 50S ribosomal protein L15 [Candidatus Moranbacteria bacterium]